MNHTFNSISIGDSYQLTKRISTENVEGFAKVSGDTNPIHLNEEIASASIFKNRIAHGFLVGSIISNILGMHFPGQGTIYLSQTMKFYKPVFLDTMVTGIVTVVEKDENKRRISLSTIVKNEENEIVIKGEAIVIPPSKNN
jgi:acyl dehydratase